MKRITLIFLTILTLAVLLTACGRESGTVSTDPNGDIGNNPTSQPSPDTSEHNSASEEFEHANDPLEDALDPFQFGVEDDLDGQPDLPNFDDENAAQEYEQTVDPQVRKRSSGTGMTGGQ